MMLDRHTKPPELKIKYFDMDLQDALLGYAKHVGLDGFPGDYNYEIFVDTKKGKVIYKWMVEKK